MCVNRHFRDEKGTGAEMRPAIVCGNVNGDATLQKSLRKLTRPSFPLACKVVNYGQTKCIMGNAYAANVLQYGVIF